MVLPVSDIRFSQENCGKYFQDGRSLKQLVDKLCDGRQDLLTASFLRLEVVSKRDRVAMKDLPGWVTPVA